jgi:hypothetical protein
MALDEGQNTGRRLLKGQSKPQLHKEKSEPENEPPNKPTDADHSTRHGQSIALSVQKDASWRDARLEPE